jgi:preprotein translocase subunit YajC
VITGLSVFGFVLLAGVGGGLASFTGLPLLLIMFAAMYFLLIAPNQKKQKQWQSQLAALKTGDRITTSGGIRGTIVAIKDDALTIRTQPDGVKLDVVKTAIAAVTTDEPAKS